MAAKKSSPKKPGASRASKTKEKRTPPHMGVVKLGKPTPPHTGVIKLGGAPKPPIGQTAARGKKSESSKNDSESKRIREGRV